MAGALLCSASIHAELGITHLPEVFGAISLLAAMGQIILALGVLVRPSRVVWQGSLVLSLTLLQLYALNVTIGLPPVIAHTHVPGSHVLFGVTLANPNTLDVQGVAAEICQIVAAISAAVSPPSRRAQDR